MSICAVCGRHLRKKANYCGVRCKSAAAATAAGFQRAAKSKHYAITPLAHPRLPDPITKEHAP